MMGRGDHGRGRGSMPSTRSQTQKLSKESYALQKASILPKKSWGSIADEEDQKDQKLLSTNKNKQVVSSTQNTSGIPEEILNNPSLLTWISSLQKNPETALAIQSQQPPCASSLMVPETILRTAADIALAQNRSQDPQNISKYFDKHIFHKVLLMEKEYMCQDPKQVVSKIFPPNWHFIPKDLRKTQKFYEFILVDSDSISLKKYYSSSDSTNITHCTVQILQILTPSMWGTDLHKPRKFSQNFDPMGYNYWDYQEAWTNTFLFQNTDQRHSWFFYFRFNQNYIFPHWFNEWWWYFGPVPQILPPIVTEGFDVFRSKFQPSDISFPPLLYFFSKFAISWISNWEYGFHSDPGTLPYLVRKFRCKWWDKFNAEKAYPQNVLAWFKSNLSQSKIQNQSHHNLLGMKSFISSKLVSAISEEELAQFLQQTLSELKSKTSQSSFPTSSSNSDKNSKRSFDSEDILDN